MELRFLLKNIVDEIKLLTAGECGLIVEFGTSISPEVNRLVQQLTQFIKNAELEGIREIVPTYRSAAIYYDPMVISYEEVCDHVRQYLQMLKPERHDAVSPGIVQIPVCYGGVLGPDLEYVAKYTGLTPAEVIRIHTSRAYLVYMLGFTPGYPYLGGLSKKLITPRLDKPRLNVPEGSVGIGGNQTGFYTSQTPGEWWLIGRTPLKGFNPALRHPFLVNPGEYIQFVEIKIDEYFAIRKDVLKGTYTLQICHS